MIIMVNERWHTCDCRYICDHAAYMGNVASVGLKMIEQSVKPEIDSFDEVFITNVVSGVTSVSSIDGIQIGSGSNEIANKFLSIYNEIILSEEFDI